MININQAVILAGGQGTRLYPFTLKNPKPMISVNGKPFLEHLINLLVKNGIKEVVILTGYSGEKIEKYFGDGLRFGIKIKYSYTPFINEKGFENKSGIRLKNAQKLLEDFFLLLYCDNYWPLDIDRLLKFFNSHPSDVLVTAYSNKDQSTKNNMFISTDGYVTKYDKGRKAKNLNCVDIGFFIINKIVLKVLPETNSLFETVVLPDLIKKGRLLGFLSNDKYYSIGNLQRVKITEKFFKNKAVFLDRDGVINKRPNKADYVKDWSEFIFLPGSIEAIKLLNKKGYKVFIISNQPGIARGVMNEKDLKNINKNMISVLKTAGAKIEGIYYCLHNWDDNCDCRKPKPGMLYQASYEHFLDLTKAIFIGDDVRDQEAGNAAGCKTILVTPRNNLLKTVRKLISINDY